MSAGRFQLHPAIPVLAGTHFVVDAYANIYAPLLPLLIPKLGLSLAAAGTMAMLFQLAASVSQLGFGQLADRWRPGVLLVVGPLLSVSVLSLIGLASSPLMLAGVLLAGGLGGAAFHPAAAAVVHRFAGQRRGLAMSIHITCGSMGFSLAPLLFASFVQYAGLSWTPLLAIPGVILLMFLVRRLPPVRFSRPGQGAGFSALRPYAAPLTLLYLIVVLRTLTSLGFATFIPVMLTSRGASVGEAGAAVALYLFASSVGGFTGGPLADRFGPKRIIAASLILSVPFLAAVPLLSGWQFLAALACGGFFLQSTLPVNITYAHAIAPVNTATVSSLMMGFAWGTGGLSVPFVGLLADHVGVPATLLSIAFVPLLGVACSWPLPSVDHPTPVGSIPSVASVR
jgi:MFS transporter, FSR family, fosmidomycin resistance protein